MWGFCSAQMIKGNVKIESEIFIDRIVSKIVRTWHYCHYLTQLSPEDNMSKRWQRLRHDHTIEKNRWSFVQKFNYNIRIRPAENTTIRHKSLLGIELLFCKIIYSHSHTFSNHYNTHAYTIDTLNMYYFIVFYLFFFS